MSNNNHTFFSNQYTGAIKPKNNQRHLKSSPDNCAITFYEKQTKILTKVIILSAYSKLIILKSYSLTSSSSNLYIDNKITIDYWLYIWHTQKTEKIFSFICNLIFYSLIKSELTYNKLDNKITID